MSGLHAAMYDQRVCRQLAFPPHRRRHKAFALLMHMATKDEEPEGPLDRSHRARKHALHHMQCLDR